MENKTKYILISAVVVFILFAGAIAYQQKTIMNLSSKFSRISDGGYGAGQNGALNNPSTVKAVQDTLTLSVKEVQGKIITKSENSLTVDAEIVDLSKLSRTKEADLTGDNAALPKIKKTYKVSVNDQTQYPSKGFMQLSEGEEVIIKSNEQVYQADSLTAIEILVPGKGDISFEDQMKNIRFIIGQVKEINEKYLIVEVNQIDASKISDPKNVDIQTVPKTTKSYKVQVDAKTIYNGTMNDIKVGDIVKAFSDKPVASVAEFTAMKIDGPIQLPEK